MGSRVGFWADDQLDERLDALVKAMQESPAFRDLDITKGAIIKAAIRRGLPFMELEQGLSGLEGPLLIGWIDTTIVELLERAEQLDIELPHYSKRKK